MAAIRFADTEHFSTELRSIHKKLGLEFSQTILALMPSGELALLRKAPGGIGVQPEPLARYSWLHDEWLLSPVSA